MFITRQKIYMGSIALLILTLGCLRMWFFQAPLKTEGLKDAEAPTGETIKIYVAGKGTINGIQVNGLGLAIYDLERQPGLNGETLQIGLVVLNTTKAPKVLDFNVAVMDQGGELVRLDKELQTSVVVQPGEISPGLIVLEVPGQNKDWELILSGGCLGGTVNIPLISPEVLVELEN